MKKLHLADWILAGAVAAACGAAPFSHSFWGGLVFHTALAAAVGGAADWFAVNSLFRKPLGISFRTRLIQRSRERIIQMALDMVEKEILTVPRLYRVLKQHSISAALFTWLSSHREEVRQVLGEIFQIALEERNFQKAAAMGGSAMKNAVVTADWGCILAKATSAVDVKSLTFALLPECRKEAEALLQEEWVRHDISSVYHDAWLRYESKGSGRAMLKGLLESQMGLTDDKALSLIHAKLLGCAEDVGNPQSPIARWIAEKTFQYWQEFATNKEWQDKIGRLIRNHIQSWMDINGTSFVQNLVDGNRTSCAESLSAYVLQYSETWMESKSNQDSLDRWALRQIVKYLPRLHETIGNSVKETLETYSGADMAKAAEQGVFHDLQMIRVNGSFVGAILGLLSYLAFYAVSGGGVL